MRIKPVFKYEPIAVQIPFAQARCLLTISVGQEVHEGEKFTSTIALVNQHFNSCILLVDDTLQRHTMVLNHTATADDFMDISRKEGEEWLRRNQIHYSQLTIPYQIIHWDRWLLHSDYVARQPIINKALQTDINYRAAFSQSIDAFLLRYHQRLSCSEQTNFNYLRAYQ